MKKTMISICIMLMILVIMFNANAYNNELKSEVNDNYATLNGTIIDDQDNKPMEGVKIILKRFGRETITKTNEKGMYEFTNLTPGNYYYIEIIDREYFRIHDGIVIESGINYYNATLEEEFIPGPNIYLSALLLLIIPSCILIIVLIVIMYLGKRRNVNDK